MGTHTIEKGCNSEMLPKQAYATHHSIVSCCTDDVHKSVPDVCYDVHNSIVACILAGACMMCVFDVHKNEMRDCRCVYDVHRSLPDGCVRCSQELA